MDFTQRAADASTTAVNAILSPIIDERLAALAKKVYEEGRGSGDGEVAFKRIGAGYIGTECSRELAFRYHKFPIETRGCDGGGTNPGELQRHADAGHWAEDMTAGWLSIAGISVFTCQADLDGKSLSENERGEAKQIGWMAARDANGQARMAGEVDGVIYKVSEPELAELIKPPCIWENKKATDKKWKKFSKEGIKKADPRYYGQLQTNMAYLNIRQTLFSMLNLDNMKFYFELVPFDAEKAQELSDRATRVIQSDHPYQFPQLGRTEDDFVCRFCNYKNQCWHPPSLTSGLPKPKFGGFNPNEMEDPPFP
jgi:hypothetical protein